MSAAGKKWLYILADVLAYEAAHMDDGELLSEFCDRLITRHPIVARGFILVFGGALVLHLANSLPGDYDLISRRFWMRLVRIFEIPPRKTEIVIR